MNAVVKAAWGLLGGAWVAGALSADAGQVTFHALRRPDSLILVMDVRPGPGDGSPGFREGEAYVLPPGGDDLRYEVLFESESRLPLALMRQPLLYASLPPVTALDGPGAEGLVRRQRYTVTEVRHGVRTALQTGPMYAVPPDLGADSMPRYADLAGSGVYALANGGRVVAGRREPGHPDLLATLWDGAPAPEESSDAIALEIPLVRFAGGTH